MNRFFSGVKTIGVLFPEQTKPEPPCAESVWRSVEEGFRKVGDNMRKAVSYEKKRSGSSEK